MSAEPILYELRDNVAWIVMNDPASLNAVTIDTAIFLKAAFDRAISEARAVVLTGAGRGFCAGLNLSNPAVLEDPKFDVGTILDPHFNNLVHCIRDLPIPFVTAVNGAAAGIGASLALLGDIIVAAESAYFLEAFRRVGLVPDGGGAYLLTRAVGRARAMEMVMLGEKISAAKALEWGLINRVVADAELQDAVQKLAKDLADGPKSLAMIRKLVWDSLDNNWADQITAERYAQRDAGYTKDFREGIDAFLNRRAPNFKGE